MWEYTEKVKEYFLNPKNVGEIDTPDAVGEVGNLACGDALRLTLKIDKGTERILDAKFKTFGCASAIASSSVLTELIKGKTLDEALQVTNKEIAAELGGLPEEKMHCSVMGQEALEKAINNYRGIETKDDHDVEGLLVCKCFNVTDTKIRQVVRENKLTTLDEVTHYTKAGGACGQCHDAINRILREELGLQTVEKVGRKVSESDSTRVEESAKPLTNLQKIKLIEETIDTVIRPFLNRDRGDIELIDIEGNVVQVKMMGSCASCIGAQGTLKHFVERMLREKVSDLLRVENVEP